MPEPIYTRVAPGKPGCDPRWTSSAKLGVGTAPGSASHLWFTVSHGIVDEIYCPEFDTASMRDAGLLITGPDRFFSEEKRDTDVAIEWIAEGVPGYTMVNTCKRGYYRITKTVISDPTEPVLLQHIRFEALKGDAAAYKLYVLAAPHLFNQGAHNTGWCTLYNGVPLLFAHRNGFAMSVASRPGFNAMSCGYVGVSDGWQDLSRNRRMTWHYDSAPDGNIALMGELPLNEGGRTEIAIAFGNTVESAGDRALGSLSRGFEAIRTGFIKGWEHVLERAEHAVKITDHDPLHVPFLRGYAMLKTHESKGTPGGVVASLSIPWGEYQGDGDLGGYHVIWPRDQVEAAGALIAAGDSAGARDTLRFLMTTQHEDGHWPQNMWLDGSPYWNGLQSDETALPILLADLLHRKGHLDGIDVWPMARKAAGYLIAAGPATQQDRWEENGGYTPFTLAAQVAALLAAADIADRSSEPLLAAYLRETADSWNASIERWTYVERTHLANEIGVDGYYVRIAPTDIARQTDAASTWIRLKNKPEGQEWRPTADIVATDALALVRYGLRAPNDPRILNTIKVIDALLKVETKSGVCWRRYNHDGYGEYDDGRPFDGSGVGRAWPLLGGERAHYELAAGNKEGAKKLLEAINRQSSDAGMLPEQVWTGPDIPERELINGKPTGSAMPLIWAHAEIVKLIRSLRDGTVFDTPPQPVERYQRKNVSSRLVFWRLDSPFARVPAGSLLRIELNEPALVHWTLDGWRTTTDTQSHDTGLALQIADIDLAPAGSSGQLEFTFLWVSRHCWEGRNYTVAIG